MSSLEEIFEKYIQFEKYKFNHHQEKIVQENKNGKIKKLFATSTVIITVSSAAVSVISAIGSFIIQSEQKASAEATAKNDWNFRGLELFMKNENTIINCNVPDDTTHLKIFTYLFEDLAVKLRDVAYARAQTCATASGNAASSAAKAENKSPEEIRIDAQTARYGTLKLLAASAFAPNTDASSSGQQSLPVIYVQISSEGQRADAAKLQQAMRKKGYKVPGIELVSTAPAHAEVRYFYDNQSSEASTLAEFSKQTLDIPTPTTVSLEKTYQNLPSGVMEYWFPKVDSP